MSDLRVDEDDRFGYGMAGCPWGVVRVAFAVGGVEELPWGCWLVVVEGSVSCYGGQPIVLRLGFLSCFAGPPGALALALYLMLAWHFGL